MRIFIATGIYPPEIGGPAEYAKNLEQIWKSKGYEVSVGVFSKWNFLFTGLRHIAYFFSILPKVFKSDFVLILDTYSSALPTVIAGKIFRKKMLLRTGGDFLWESYVERTGNMILLRDFYEQSIANFSEKEKIIFRFTKFVLKSVDAVIWSTDWQKNIFMAPYGLELQRHFIVENYYGKKISSFEPTNKNFVGAARNLKWKNLNLLKRVFGRDEVKNGGAVLDLKVEPHKQFLKKISSSYAVILSSLGDISPNTIIDAITLGVPVIVTKETGIYERIKDVAIFVEPKSPNDVEEKVLWLLKPENYSEQKKKLASWNFVHDWNDIASEYEKIYYAIQ